MKFFFPYLLFPFFIWAETSLYQINLQKYFNSGVDQNALSESALAKKGDFAIGSLSSDEAVFIRYDGNSYKVTKGGALQKVDEKEGIAIANAILFQPAKHFDVGAANTFVKLDQEILPHFDSQNIPYAILITGTFNHIKLNSTYSKQKPDLFELNDIKGSLVGFWMPSSLSGIAFDKFHFHFISQDRKKGGRVIEVSSAKGIGAITPIFNLNLEFPKTKEFLNARIN
ncbi:MAG: acetolactate decarboxylase [Simkaniaceae bacterium]